VGVAGNLSEEAVAAGAGAPGGKNVNPVAVEVPVNATGTRPTETNGKRDLFSEETSTVLVFENGAVIRLSAAVATGQLLFLTNSKTKREVVCQIKKKRSFRPTSCYVELEFTEAVTDFWGVDFSANEETEQSAVAAEMVAESEEANDEFVEATPAPNQEEVKKLKDEVVELRQQLKALRDTANATVSADGAEAQVGAASPALPSVAAFTLPDIAPLEKPAVTPLEKLPRQAEAKMSDKLWDKPEEPPAEGPFVEVRVPETVAPARVEESPKAEVVAPAEKPADKPVDKKRVSETVEDTIGVAIPWRDEEFAKKGKEEEKAPEAEKAHEADKAAGEGEKSLESSKLRIAMALPNRVGTKSPAEETKLLARQQEEMELLESLLPKPELDFSKSSKIVHAAPGEDMSIYRMPRTKAEIRRIKAMVTLLVVVAIGGAFYTKLIPLPNVRKWMRKKSAVVAVAPAGDASAGAGKNVAAGTPASGTAASVNADANGAVAAKSDESRSAGQKPENTEAVDAGASGGAAKPVVAAEKPAATASEEHSRSAKELKKEALAEALAMKKAARSAGKNPETKDTAAVSAAEPVASDAPVMAAKLTRMVNPVYPPDAMLNYITGDVKVDAVVDASGKVGAVKVISGPAPLRQAAVDALKQYEYAPATQGGRAVESHVVVTVKFWFNP
jgi:TonB family protein